MNLRPCCVHRFANSRTVGIAFGVLFSILLGLAPSALAVDTTWIGGPFGFWTDSFNWDNGEPTDSSFDVYIDNGSAAAQVFLLDVTRNINSLTVGDNDELIIGSDTSVAQLNVDNGVTNDGSIYFGSNGSYTYFNMPSATFQNNGTLYFGTGGSSVRYFVTNLVNEER